MAQREIRAQSDRSVTPVLVTRASVDRRGRSVRKGNRANVDRRGRSVRKGNRANVDRRGRKAIQVKWDPKAIPESVGLSVQQDPKVIRC